VGRLFSLQREHVRRIMQNFNCFPFMKMAISKNFEAVKVSGAESQCKVETPIDDSIRELVNWECKEHGVKS
jgi:hypothetical protein